MGGIGTISSAADTARPGQGGGGLDAQKAQCERQLADWVHCVSAKTPEGKAKIAEYSTKLAAINHQMKQADDARARAGEAARAQQQQARQDRLQPRPRASALQTAGSVIDTWA